METTLNREATRKFSEFLDFIYYFKQVIKASTAIQPLTAIFYLFAQPNTHLPAIFYSQHQTSPLFIRIFYSQPKHHLHTATFPCFLYSPPLLSSFTVHFLMPSREDTSPTTYSFSPQHPKSHNHPTAQFFISPAESDLPNLHPIHF